MNRNKKHYRIINEVSSQPNAQPSPFVNRKHLQNLTKSLMKQKKFMYIDINEEQGFKIMKECESSDEDDEVQTIGKKYLVNLNNLFTKNSKGLSYIYRFKEENKRKDHALQLVKEQLKRSTQKIESIGKAKMDQSANQSSINNNKSIFQRYISIKSDKQAGASMQKSSLTASPIFNKSSRYYQTVSFDMKGLMTRYQTPKKREKDINPYSMRSVLPDIKRIRKNLRI